MMACAATAQQKGGAGPLRRADRGRAGRPVRRRCGGKEAHAFHDGGVADEKHRASAADDAADGENNRERWRCVHF